MNGGQSLTNARVRAELRSQLEEEREQTNTTHVSNAARSAALVDSQHRTKRSTTHLIYSLRSWRTLQAPLLRANFDWHVFAPPW